jgi:hypothetical protein
VSEDNMFNADFDQSLEQAQTAFENFAKYLGTFRDQLIAQGFSVSAAERIVEAWFANALRNDQP